MPRGRTPGVHIPARARNLLRLALVREGDALAKREPDGPVAPYGLRRVALAHGLDHSHLCRCLPEPTEYGPRQPARRPSFVALVGMLDMVPATVRREVREIAVAAAEVEGLEPDESPLVAAVDAAGRGVLVRPLAKGRRSAVPA